MTLFRTESPRATSIHVKTGSAFHLVLGSSGAVLLSALNPAARQRIIENAPDECWQFQTRADVSRRIADVAKGGASADSGSYRPMVFAISAPLYDRSGAIVAAITAIGFREDFDGPRMKPNRKRVIETAARCSELLQGGMSDKAHAA